MLKLTEHIDPFERLTERFSDTASVLEDSYAEMRYPVRKFLRIYPQIKLFSGKLALALLLLIFSVGLKAQGDPKNEEELKKQAAQYFEDEDYANGYKAYSKLVSNYPKDPNYNYRLGVCMLFTDPDKKKCYSYLELANKNIKDCEKEAKFYLAKAYHMNFRFDDAIATYVQYKAIASSSMAKKLQVDMEINACKNGKKLLSNLNELVVLDKKQLAEAEYFRSYNLKDIGGKLLVKPEDYMTAADKKKKNKSIIYMPKSADQIYYASYGNGSNKDIYIVRKLPNGKWSEPQNLGAPINTEFDEDYPFLHPNGRVIYFASKGHNSMGGYDLFKSEFNESSGTWGKPVNLDFPINTPNDDILFVTDSLEKTAYFSSTRQSPSGKIDVFRINTERRPPEFIYVKGTVLKNSQEQSVASRFTIKDINAGENVGTFQADATSGNYLIKIPNGGKFIFTVETPGFPTQSEGIDIPVSNSLLPYKQSAYYEKQTLVLKNFFQTNPDNEDGYKDYMEIIEEKSKLNVNASDFTGPATTNTTTATTNTTVATNNSGNNTNPTKTNANTNLTNQQIEEMAFTDAKELNDEAVKLKDDATDAFTFVNNKKAEADLKEKEALTAIENANKETNQEKKEVLLKQAEELKDEATKIEDQAKVAETIAKQLELDANNKQKEADLQLKYAEALKEVNKSKNNKEALAKLEAIQKEMDQLNNQTANNTNDLATSIKNEAARKDEEISKIEPKVNKLKDDVKELNKEISDVDTEIKATKDKTLLENLKAQKEELTTELNNKNNDLKKEEDKVAILKKESDALKSQADFATKMINDVKSDGNLTPITNNTSGTNNTTASNNNTNTSGNNDTNSGNNNNTTANNNNATNNTTTNNNTANNSNAGNETALTPIQQADKSFNDEITKLNAQPESSNRYADQNKVIDNYIGNIDKEIADQKTALKTAKANEKTAINNKIKELEAKKKDLQDDKKINDSKIAYFKNIEANSTAANNNNTTNNNATNNNTANNNNTTNNTTDTNTTNNTNSTSKENGDLSKKLDDLNNNANSFTNNDEKNLFNNNSFTNKAAEDLKKKAEADYNKSVEDAKKTSDKIAGTKSSLGSNNNVSTEQINTLRTEADKLTAEATQLRKDSKNLTGPQKQENLNKIKSLEDKAAKNNLDAALLTAKKNEVEYSNNKSAIDEYIKANGTKDNTDIQKAKTLIDEAKTAYNNAMRIEEEANAEPNIAAKSAQYSNVEEAETLALQKQNEALALLKKNNSGFTPSVKSNSGDSNVDKNISAIETELNNESAAKTSALNNLAEANKMEYTFVEKQLNENKSKANGTNPAIDQKAKEAAQLAAEANKLLNDAVTRTSGKEKDALIVEATKKLNNASDLAKQANAESEQLLKTNSNIANNTSGNNNSTTNNNSTANNNSTSGNNNTATNNNTSNNNSTANNNSTSGNNNTTANNNTNNNSSTNNNSTAGNNNVTTANTATVTPGNLTPAEVAAVKQTPEYSNYKKLNDDAVKNENLAAKESKKANDFYDQARLYLQESNDLRIQLDKLPPGEEKSLKQDQAIKLDRLANEFKAKGDSVNELANNTKQFAENKRLEAEAYGESLDPKTYEKIKIIEGSTGPATVGTNTVTTSGDPKFADYSPEFSANASKIESDLNNLKSGEENTNNLNSQNTLLNNYNSNIDKEIKNEKAKLTTATAADKTKINNRIKNLETQKTNNNKQITANNNKIKSINQAAVVTTNGGNNPTTNGGNNPTTNGGNNPTTNGGNNPSTTSTTGVVVKNNNAYGANNPIPIDQKLPNGVIFAVQIGAFKNAIPDNTFKGLSPLRGETTAQGFIRYQAGRFEKYDEANAVKNDLKKLGYKDAFVVVYRDGQRITLNEAINELKAKGITVNNDPNATAGISPNSNVPNASTVATVVGSNNPATTTTGNPVVATELEQTQGMLFTVQIGVYSSNVNDNQLYNLKPIYREKLPNGNYRYTAGIYNNIDKVKTDRAKVNALGITDAFVSAYQNGQRIKIADALDKIAAGGNIQFPPENPIQFGGASGPVTTPVTTPTTNTVTPTTNTVTPTTNTVQPFNNGVTQGPQPTAENGVKVGDEGITYKVQIGAYKNQVPQNVANNFLKIKEWPIATAQINGLYIYTVGSYVDLKSARPLREQALVNGITDAFITVYKDGKKLYGAEASKYLTP